MYRIALAATVPILAAWSVAARVVAIFAPNPQHHYPSAELSYSSLPQEKSCQPLPYATCPTSYQNFAAEASAVLTHERAHYHVRKMPMEMYNGVQQ